MDAGTSIRRAFIAVIPPQDVLEAISALVPSEPSRLMQWTDPIRWHVSVDFLGRVNDVEALVEDIEARLAEVEPFAIRLRSAGAFAEARRAEVFWLGVEDPDSGLRAAHAHVRDAATDHGIRIAAQIFTPHLTLARLRRRADLRPDIAALDGVAIGDPWVVEELSFLDAPRSGLRVENGPNRSPYKHVSTLRLKG